MKKYICILALLLLAGCAAPPPEPTPATSPAPAAEPTPEPTSVGIEIDIGDGEHTFWVELIKGEERTQVNIYRNSGDSEPVQSVEDMKMCSPDMVKLTAEDVDFDGYTDFHYHYKTYYTFLGTGDEYIGFHSSYYVWDPEEQCFRPDPYGLKDWHTLELDPEKKIIKKLLGDGDIGGTQISYYRYEESALICVRVIEWGVNLSTKKVDLLVEDGWDGELKTVYEREVDVGEWSKGAEWSKGTGSIEEFNRWFDLDYHGE